MCTVCGCGQGETRIDGTGHEHPHHHPHQHKAAGFGISGAHAPGLSQRKMVQVEQDILSKNNQYAAANRRSFSEKGIFALNLVSSPGSGKTTLLTRIIALLNDPKRIAVIEGDQQTSLDADRIRATGVAAVQVNTGKGCHLDAHMVGHAFEKIDLSSGGLLLIENVGNLVCPAAFDLGEAHKVAILSVTEGEDKPLKYPDMFAAADLMLLNKVDLLPYLNYDVPKAIEYARRVNPDIRIILTSAVSGEGMNEWQEWLESGMKRVAVM
jgi:hydrogenase nickel incorporation protein HypB